jgi:hypothetical protein
LDTFIQHKENIKDFSRVVMSNCQDMYNLLSDELDLKEIKEQALYGYHSMAFSAFMTMKAYYLQNDELAHSEFDNFIDKFEQFSREFVSSREISHSMQWTFGYYNELAEAYNDLANLLDLKPVEIPE